MTTSNQLVKVIVCLGACFVLNACGRLESNIQISDPTMSSTSDLIQDNRLKDSNVVPGQTIPPQRESQSFNMNRSIVYAQVLPSKSDKIVTAQSTDDEADIDETEVLKMLEGEEEENSAGTPEDSAKEEAAQLEGPGVLKPTIYYFPTINEDQKKCDAKDRKTLHGAGGKELTQVCSSTEDICGEQGTCAVVQNGKTRTFNIIGRFKGQDRYFEISKDGCVFGYGVRSSCLDPFYTLAADLKIYKPGEVIFVPAVEGLELPDGSKHTGYFVIRDKGRGIVGRGRFDFFSGTLHWADSKNPFKKLGLGDVKTNIPYYRVSGVKASSVLKERSYPKLPRR